MELMVVVSIIAILALMNIPVYTSKMLKVQYTEVFEMLDVLKREVKDYYEHYGEFPQSNIIGGLPSPEYLIGNYVESVEVEQGAIHVHFGNKAHNVLNGKVLSIRPQVVIGSPSSPISWLCGSSEPPSGMQAIGENRTDIELIHLPYTCR